MGERLLERLYLVLIRRYGGLEVFDDGLEHLLRGEPVAGAAEPHDALAPLRGPVGLDLLELLLVILDLLAQDGQGIEPPLGSLVGVLCDAHALRPARVHGLLDDGVKVRPVVLPHVDRLLFVWGGPSQRGGLLLFFVREGVVVVIPSGGVVPARAPEELHVVRDALGDRALVPILVLVAAVVPAPDDRCLPSLGEVAAAQVCGVPPRDDRDVVGDAVAVLVLVVSLDGKREAASRHAAAGGAALGVSGEVTDEDYSIHAGTPSR